MSNFTLKDLYKFSKSGSGSLLSHADRIETRGPITTIPLILFPNGYVNNLKSTSPPAVNPLFRYDR